MYVKSLLYLTLSYVPLHSSQGVPKDDKAYWQQCKGDEPQDHKCATTEDGTCDAGGKCAAGSDLTDCYGAPDLVPGTRAEMLSCTDFSAINVVCPVHAVGRLVPGDHSCLRLSAKPHTTYIQCHIYDDMPRCRPSTHLEYLLEPISYHACDYVCVAYV